MPVTSLRRFRESGEHGRIALASGADAGLYLLLPATLVAFVSGVLNAWYFLLPPSEERRARNSAGKAEG